MTPDSRSVSTEEVLSLLADPQRRRVLSYLRDCDGAAASVTELAAAVAAERSTAGRSSADGGTTVRPTVDSDGTAVERVATQLHHNHLPRLYRAGVVDYDDQGGIVRYRPHEEIEATLDFIAECEE